MRMLIVADRGSCGVLLLALPADDGRGGRASRQGDAPGADVAATRLRWIFLAAVPSGLLIAVTAHISTDVAAAPLCCGCCRLSLYLLTWVLVFQSRPLLPHDLDAVIAAVRDCRRHGSAGGRRRAEPAARHSAAICFASSSSPWPCHGELARTRPAAISILTGFYVALSFGGMVGGLFAGLVAPYTFTWIAEYPILLALAVLCRPPGAPSLRGSFWVWAVVMAITLLVLALAFGHGVITAKIEANRVWAVTYVALAFVILALLWRLGRWQLAAVVAAGLVLIRVYPGDDGRVETVRSFFGVHKIVVTPSGRYHVLMHGTTIHGAEKFFNKNGTPVTGRPEPISYYHKDGGIGQAIDAIRQRKGGPIRVAVIGLGAGTLACQSQPGENWTFFEIDQTMVDTRARSEVFQLHQCLRAHDEAGDGRRAADLRQGKGRDL